MPNLNTAEIEILIERLHKKEITPKELKQLEEWYSLTSDSPLIWDLKEGSRLELRDEMLSAVKGNLTLSKPKTHPFLKYAAAAAIMFFALGTILFFSLNLGSGQPTMITVTSTAGKVIRIYLPDSSIVWLKGKSQIQYPESFKDSTRNVLLSGEALFEVAKDKKHPFIIKTNRYMARVLGTSFNINENSNMFKLTVLTGKVAVFNLDVKNKAVQQSAPLVITSGNELEASVKLPSPKVMVARADNKKSIFNGTEYDMGFSNTPFIAVKERIEKKFDVTINANADAYAGCIISADLTDQSLENTMSLVAAALNAKYTKTDNILTLTGGGCN